MKNKIGWIIGGSLVVIFGLFIFVATTVMAPEPKLVKDLTHFLIEHHFEEVSNSEVAELSNGRRTTDTFYELEIASDSVFWDVKIDLNQVCNRLELQPSSDMSEIYIAPRAYQQIVEVEWIDPNEDNTVWPQTITIRIRRYVE